MWRVFYAAIGFGLIVGASIYLALYLGGRGMLASPAVGVPVGAVGGLLLGLTYYLFFKFVLRAFTAPFLERAQALVTRPIEPLGPAWQSSELDKLEEVLTEALATLKRLDLFSSIARDIVSTLDFQKTLERVVSTAVETMPVDSGLVFLLDEQSQRYTIRASYRLPVSGEWLDQITFALDEGVPGWVTTQGHALIIDDAESDERVHALFRQNRVKSLISVPLVIGNRPLGVLNLFNCGRRNAFDENDVRLANIYADLAAVAIDNARFYREAEDERGKLAAILGDTTDAVVVVDHYDRVLLINPAAEQYLGVRSAELTGKPLSALGVDDLPMALEEAKRATGPVVREISAPDERTLYASVSPVHNVGWVMVMQDITALKDLDRLRTEWVAAVSHDLKNPITIIQMSAGLMGRVGPLTDEQQELLGRTLNSVERLRSLVIDVLDLARLEAGPTLRVGKVDLGEVIGQAVREIEPLTTENEQILVSDAPPDLPYALGDATLLTRALTNLLSNAVKYTPQRGWVTVRAFLAHPQDTVLHVEVQDTGRGIPAEAIPHLFERFYRVPGSEEHAEGTGLGLSIVQSIVEKHGGHIWVDSTLGEGSTFTFTVPIKP